MDVLIERSDEGFLGAKKGVEKDRGNIFVFGLFNFANKTVNLLFHKIKLQVYNSIFHISHETWNHIK